MPGRLTSGPQPGEQRRFHAALLPLRLFFGATFLYAGLDKVLDPAFLQASGRGSIGANLAGYAQASPLGGLVAFVVPLAVPIGLGIALAEIAVGLGTLLGLAFRVAALGGALLSTLFFLTASWSVRPFYLGNDLPYAAGWLTLALAGHGGLLALDAVLAGRMTAQYPRALPGRGVAPRAAALGTRQPLATRQSLAGGELGRRGLLKLAALGFMAISLAGISTVVEAVLGRRAGVQGSGTPTPDPSLVAGGPTPSASPPSPQPSPQPTPQPSLSASPSPPQGKLIARVADVTAAHPVVFQDPFTSDPGIVLRLKDGSFVAFDTVCTHAACTVDFEASSGYLVCPCHGAVFDPARDAKPIDGPTFLPLSAFPIVVDEASGTIRLLGE